MFGLRWVGALQRAFHTTAADHAWATKSIKPTKFIASNKNVFPPQREGEEPRPAYVCHQKCNIKYSYKKMWYIASFVRGMAVDEALKQLSFISKKGAADVIETIQRAQRLAVDRHNVEFKSNLWVAESFCGKGQVIKGMRRHAKGRVGEIRYGYVHYFVRLEEGTPPENYYQLDIRTNEERLSDWYEYMRKRRIVGSL